MNCLQFLRLGWEAKEKGCSGRSSGERQEGQPKAQEEEDRQPEGGATGRGEVCPGLDSKDSQ